MLRLIYVGNCKGNVSPCVRLSCQGTLGKELSDDRGVQQE